MQKIILFIVLIVTTVFLSNIASHNMSNKKEQELREAQCWEYAKRDHEKEFYPDRWNTIVEPMQVSSEQWFEWCMDNISNPVAK